MKKFKFVLSAMFMLVLICTGVKASGYADIPEFKVTINGTQIDNSCRSYPFLVYKNITYFPLTYYDCRYLGLITEWSDSSKTLSIKKENITGAYRDYSCEVMNDSSNMVELCPFNVFVNGRSINNPEEEYPFITFRGVTYFPLTWRFAVDEFGWEYGYSADGGLVINSSNRQMERLYLPELRTNYPSAATDGEYYYYTGTENRVFRVPCNDFSKKEVIHTLDYTYSPDTTPVDFSYVDGKVYMSYRVGGATMGTSYRYVINSDGTVEKSNEGTHYTSGVGFNGYVIDGDGFTVERYNSGRVGTSAVYYSHDGTDENIEIKKDDVIFGEYKDISMNLNGNGSLLGANDEGNAWFNDPQVLGRAIYLTGYESGKDKNSDLYRVDTETGNIEKVMENVAAFHAFYGWDPDMNTMSEMVLYEMKSRGNMLYRFSYLSKKMYQVQSYVPPLKLAIGDVSPVCVFDDGKVTQVWCYDGYGIGSLHAKVFESNKGFEFASDNGMLIGTSHYADDVKSVFLTDFYDFTQTCELPENIFVCKNNVLMTVLNEDNSEGFIVEMNME